MSKAKKMSRPIGKRPVPKKKGLGGKKPMKTKAKIKNKHFTKLVKRGEKKPKSGVNPYLKNQQEKAKKLQEQEERLKLRDEDRFSDIDEEQPPEDDVLDMLEPEDRAAFEAQARKRRDDESSSEDEDDEEDDELARYERQPRFNPLFNGVQNTRALKESESEDDEDEEMEEEDEDEEDESEEEVEKERQPSLVELYASRTQRLEQIKERIGTMATKIIAEPHQNLSALKELLSMLDIMKNVDGNKLDLIFLSVQRLVAYSCLEIFKDILPTYRIIEQTHEEETKNERQNFRLKKETKKLREFERELLTLYRYYLQRLNRMVNCVKKTKKQKSHFYDSMLHNQTSKEKMACVGARCISELLLTRPEINYSGQLLEIIVPLMNSKKPDLAKLACDTMQKLYRNDKSGVMSLAGIKATATNMKSFDYRVNPQMLRTFLALNIKEVKWSLLDGSEKEGKVSRKTLSRSERKRKKAAKVLEKQLKLTEAQESSDRRLKNHTHIINQIFACYFRILKRNVSVFDENDERQKKRILKHTLSPVLEGLARFAHLLNVEFFDDVISLLFALINSKLLNNHQNLLCMQTVFTILSGEGSSLNIDPQRFYLQLYATLLSLNLFTPTEDIEALLNCINLMIIRRKKQLTINRILAFIKRLSTMSLQIRLEVVFPILLLVRQSLVFNKQADCLLDVDSAAHFGSGVFNPEVEDPEHSSAQSAVLWELHLLRSHPNPKVQILASHILDGCKGNQLSPEVLKRKPTDFLPSENTDHLEGSWFVGVPPPEKVQVSKKSRNFGLTFLPSSLTQQAYSSWQPESLKTPSLSLKESDE